MSYNRRLEQDVVVGGYRVPAGVSNLHYFHYTHTFVRSAFDCPLQFLKM